MAGAARGSWKPSLCASMDCAKALLARSHSNRL